VSSLSSVASVIRGSPPIMNPVQTDRLELTPPEVAGFLVSAEIMENHQDY
jgi:hypothetical protein